MSEVPIALIVLLVVGASLLLTTVYFTIYRTRAWKHLNLTQVACFFFAAGSANTCSRIFFRCIAPASTKSAPNSRSKRKAGVVESSSVAPEKAEYMQGSCSGAKYSIMSAGVKYCSRNGGYISGSDVPAFQALACKAFSA